LRVLVTGGAGFIGSQLCKVLLNRGDEVTVLDNFSSSSHGNLQRIPACKKINVVIGDCKNRQDIRRALAGAETVYHLAANPVVRLDHSDPSTCFQENAYATHALLDEVRKRDVNPVVFTSSSTVYGDARLLPTPESYGPLEPISYYGAAKLASEALISAFSYTYGITGIILRLANVIGPRSKHGIINDLLAQIKKRPRGLRVLGNGRQIKSYLYIDDCISGIIHSVQSSQKSLNVFNVGSSDQIEVKAVARIILAESGVDDMPIEFTGGTEEGRGWNGDVKNMLLDVSKLRSKGWRPKYTSEEAIRITVRSVLDRLPLPANRLA